MKDLAAVERGDLQPSRVWEVAEDGQGGIYRRLVVDRTKPANSAANDATRARMALKLSQDNFARLLGISAGTLRGWEQGRRQPNQAATVLLHVAMAQPDAVLAVARRLLKKRTA